MDRRTQTDTETAAREQDQVWPTRVIRRGEAVRPLPPHTRSLEDLTFEVGGVPLNVGDHMARCRTTGILILKNGEIALERYGAGGGPERRGHSYSTAKSMTATLVGAALHDGAIASLDEPCEAYLSRLRGSAYTGVTIRNALRMCSGVAWSEEDDGQSDVGRLRQALESRRPGSLLDLACTLPRAQPQGVAFNYSTVESCLGGLGGRRHRPAAGRVLRREGLGAGRHGSQRVLGAGVRGRPGAGRGRRHRAAAGLCALWPVHPGGRRPCGRPPHAAAGLARSGRPARLRGHRHRCADAALPAGYGYQWWAVPRSPANASGGAFLALGAFGQRIFVNPAEQVVAVMLSAWPQHHDADADAESVALLHAAVPALRADPVT